MQQKHAGGKRIFNALQTNGTLLDDAWGAFLAENQFLIGLSIDGPPKLHDAYRVDKKGGATYQRVRQGLNVLKKWQVEFNTLTVVNRINARKPLEVYRFLKEIGSGFLQFIPLVERLADGNSLASPPEGAATKKLPVTEWSVEPPQYGEFLCTIFDEWVRHDVGRTFVQMFDVTLGNWMKQGSSLCVFSEKCGSALAMEHNGDVYSCDHYVYPQYKLGNILNSSLGEMANSVAQQSFGNAKADSLPRYCHECDVRELCHGECPKHRFISTPDGEPRLNYLCQAYKRFFSHSAPAMQRMGALIQSGRAAADIISWAKNR